MTFQLDYELKEGIDIDFLEEIMSFWEIDNPWSLIRIDMKHPYHLSGYFESEEALRNEWSKLKALFPGLTEEPVVNEIEEQDWQNAYKAYLKPWNFGPLHWVPVWEKEAYAIPEGECGLYLDAGMAFGTGAHETTQLCARRLIEYKAKKPEGLEEKKVIDAGCGSGILALSAHLLGYKHIEAFDLDPQAIEVSLENADLNNLSGEVKFFTGDLTDGLRWKHFDIIVANILADVLMGHAQLLIESLRARGSLILSGILTKEIEELTQVFEKTAEDLGIEYHVESRELGEWSDLLFEKSE